MTSPSGLLEYVVRVRAKRNLTESTWSHRRGVDTAAECSVPEPECEMSERVAQRATEKGRAARDLPQRATKMRQPELA